MAKVIEDEINKNLIFKIKDDVNDEGKNHGKGVITYPNGEKYVGEFYDNSYHGKDMLFNYYQFE